MIRKTPGLLTLFTGLVLACLIPSLAAAQSGPICSRFGPNNTDGWAACPPPQDNIGVTTSNESSKGGPNDYFLRLSDEANASQACSRDEKYKGNWITKFGSCAQFCFDIRIWQICIPDDKPNPNPERYPVPLCKDILLHPSFNIRSGSNVASFTSTLLISERRGPNPGWFRVCAPIRLTQPGEALPSDEGGQWTIGSSNGPNPLWNSILTNVTAIELTPDYTSSNTEIVDYDNICMSGVPCPGREASLKLCKIAGSGVAIGTPFNFVVGSTPVTVPAGAPVTGNCIDVVDKALTVGSNVTIKEAIPPNTIVSSITVTPPSAVTGSPDLAAGSVNITLVEGTNVVTFTDVSTRTEVNQGCLKGSKADVKCNADGTVTVTLTSNTPAGFSGSTIELISQTPGVAVQMQQQPYAPTTTWTIVGGTPGQTVKLFANIIQNGGGSVPEANKCCSGEIEITMPECPKQLDVKIEKTGARLATPDLPMPGFSNLSFTLTMTNLSAGFTGASAITVTDIVPPGMTFNSASGSNWDCGPSSQFPIAGGNPLTCTYTGVGPAAPGEPLGTINIAAFSPTNGPWENCAEIGIAAAVGKDVNLANNKSCVTLDGRQTNALIVKKEVEYRGTNPLPPISFPIGVSCKPSNVNPSFTLANGGSVSVINIPLGSTCTVLESLPPPPSNICPQGTVAAWSMPSYEPPSIVVAAGPPQTIIVKNKLECRRQTEVGALTVKKEVEYRGPIPLPPISFPVTVTCKPSDVNPSFTLGNSDARTVINIPVGSICSVLETPPPPPNACGPGFIASWAPPIYTPSSVVVSGGAPQTITVTNTLTCQRVTTLVCRPPMVLNAAKTECTCPPGSRQRGRECVKVPECRAPMIPSPRGGCSCPAGTIQKGRECIRKPVCNPPAKLNTAGTACICPPNTVAQGGRCVERARPTIDLPIGERRKPSVPARPSTGTPSQPQPTGRR